MNFTDCLRGTLILADGAWGTELQKLGAPLGACLDEWNLIKPELVRQVAESYIQAGSKVILTNTFRANPISLAAHGLEWKDACNERRYARTTARRILRAGARAGGRKSRRATD